jgi:hypothetical protein
MVSDLVEIPASNLTPAQYSGLSDVPPEVEWLANITNAKTRRFYKMDVAEFITLTGLKGSASIRTVARSHVIARRKDISAEAIGVCVHSMRAMRQPTRFQTRRTLLRCRSGWDMRTSPRPDSTTGARRGLKTVRRFM